jgi:hypothetical protein
VLDADLMPVTALPLPIGTCGAAQTGHQIRAGPTEPGPINLAARVPASTRASCPPARMLQMSIPRIVHTAHLHADELAQIRGLLDQAFE